MTSTPKIVALNKETHAKTTISGTNLFEHISQEHMLPVVVHEFVAAGGEFPVAFVKNSQNETFQPVAILGLEAKQNLFIKEGKWQPLYVPRAIRNYPLVLVQEAPDSERLLVALDESSSRVTEGDGQPLFNEDGTESEFLASRKQQMVEFLDLGQFTRNFTAKLQELDLLSQQTLTITINNEPRTINGLYVVDEKKLNELSDEVFLELRKTGFLTGIYAHLMSLQQTQKLVQKLAEASAK